MVTSTYRVQVRGDFDLDAAAGLAGYLRALGATHMYSAPILTARSGSVHGYDGTDPTAVNPELGGPEALDRLVAALRREGLGLVVDIVPNHLGVAVPHENPAWWSVLRDGPDSPYAGWFDVDWSRGPIVIPVLGDDPAPGGDSLSGGGAELRVEDGELRYFEHRYPIAAGTGDGSPHEVHARQHYRLVPRRRGDADLTYRRFFAVSDLAAVRVEDPAVFDATHAEIARWVAAGLVEGLRVDHPDGLRDPGGYLRRLRALAPHAWIVVEKILQYGERLPDWPVDGTTGYDALREICGVFVDSYADDAFPAPPYPEAVLAAKRDVAYRLFGAELRRLHALAGGGDGIVDSLVETAAQLPVYRTYLPDGADLLDAALARAHVTLVAGDGADEATCALSATLGDPAEELTQRFQQFSGAVMGKGIEDTVFYRWTRFVALNEVGGAPDHFGVGVHEFHDAMADRSPRSMTALSTHDTKRSEDVRARLAVLAEIPQEWHAAVAGFPAVPGDPGIEALLHQTVVGAWPIEADRLHAYATKAAREANVATSWNAPDEVYEAEMHAAVDALLADAGVRAFAARITPYGWANSLGQKLVQLTTPGVPDTYQGTELWDYSLVDPDNRRPVDFDARRSLLAKLDDGWLPPVDDSGAAKLLVTSRALRLRRDHPELFGGYEPLEAAGPAALHVLAFDRGGAITVATRLPATLERDGGFGDDDLLLLPADHWRDALTGRDFTGPAIGLAGLLAEYPVALLAVS